MLPVNGDLSLLYEFSTGGILSILPTEEEKKIGYSPTPTIDKELIDFINQFIEKSLGNLAFFIDYLAEDSCPKFKKNDHIEYKVINGEVYYCVNSILPSTQLQKIIRMSNYGWYFLCVLSNDADIDDNLKKSNLDPIWDNLNYIITCAYDREGYVFWERNK